MPGNTEHMNNNSEEFATPVTRLNVNCWPAKLDLAQSLSGLLLALFMWGHMFLVSSILISEEAMYHVAKMFEGYYLFGRSYPWLVSLVVGSVFVLFMLHALLAMRKLPHNYAQLSDFTRHNQRMNHADTRLWWLQAVSGFLLFFFAPMHLFGMFSQPDQIGPYMSAWRVYSTHWSLYLVLLFLVELHGGIGLYRLVVKWVSLPLRTEALWKRRLNLFKWSLTTFFVVLGLATLFAYYQLGATLQDHPTRVFRLTQDQESAL